MARILLALASLVALVAGLSALQRRFDGTDVRRGIAQVLAHRPAPGLPSVLEALEALGERDLRCDGEIVSRLLGDVRVRCASPSHPEVVYAFRVLLGGGRPPRAESGVARPLLAGREGDPAPRAGTRR